MAHTRSAIVYCLVIRLFYPTHSIKLTNLTSADILLCRMLFRSWI
uniref:Aminopeptidase M1-like isoform X2 n=1 Tax=Rhizophora mucronata TaxID=61149 RepID=A0A2P2J3F4_RHIMU